MLDFQTIQSPIDPTLFEDVLLAEVQDLAQTTQESWGQSLQGVEMETVQ